MTRTMSKNVNRFLLVGRVVRKKLTRATQQELEVVKESRQRSIFTAAAIFFGPIFAFNQGTELAGIRRFSDCCDSLASLARLLSFALWWVMEGLAPTGDFLWPFVSLLWYVWPQIGDSLWPSLIRLFFPAEQSRTVLLSSEHGWYLFHINVNPNT